MHDLELARVIQAEREREIERGLRIRALRNAIADRDGSTFVPRLADPANRITQALRLLEMRRLG